MNTLVMTNPTNTEGEGSIRLDRVVGLQHSEGATGMEADLGVLKDGDNIAQVASIGLAKAMGQGKSPYQEEAPITSCFFQMPANPGAQRNCNLARGVCCSRAMIPATPASPSRVLPSGWLVANSAA